MIFNSYHQSAIRGISLAIQKPIFVSAGDDHTIRLWNYQTMSIEQMQYYAEPVYAIALHPSGHQMVVAFASKVSLMNVLIDGFSTLKEYPIHAAHNILFRLKKKRKIFTLKHFFRCLVTEVIYSL